MEVEVEDPAYDRGFSLIDLKPLLDGVAPALGLVW
jgi:hypothetical protein